MDVSADLPELTRCPVGLVSAGVKSILDIGRCVELITFAFSMHYLNHPLLTSLGPLNIWCVNLAIDESYLNGPI